MNLTHPWIGTVTETRVQEVISSLRERQSTFARTPVAEILTVIEAVGKLWQKGSPYYRRAQAEIGDELSFSTEMIIKGLDLVETLCSRQQWEERIRAEFSPSDVLDRFQTTSGFAGRLRRVPHGLLLHVSAGNIFLGAIDSLLLGLVSKNVSLVKLSSDNQTFPKLFAESVVQADPDLILSSAFAFLHWQGGSEKIEKKISENVDAVVAWGGGEMMRNYRNILPEGIPLIEHGPKYSFQVLSRDIEITEVLLKKITKDVIDWDQSACASPQNLWFEVGTNENALLTGLKQAFEIQTLPRGPLSPDERVEILKERHRAYATSSHDGGRFVEGDEFLIHLDPRPGARASPLSRTLILKPYTNLENLVWQLKGARHSLQSCGLAVPEDQRDEYLNELARLGVHRFAAIGEMLAGMPGAPHDGRGALIELGRWVSDERSLGFIPNLESYPIQDRLDSTLPDFKGTRKYFGQVFSSGGTTGEPKSVFFEETAFQKTAELLAQGLQAGGRIGPGSVVANLFVAGNMWSSFLAVDRALQSLRAVRLPIGGLSDPEFVLKTLLKHRPDVLVGLPSLLIALAQKFEREGLRLVVKNILYAGEHLTQCGRHLLSRVFGNPAIDSAGYASVDAGPIGYSCGKLAPREHHVFEEAVHLEILDGEGIVTSLLRKAMPVIRLRTGDHLEWSSAAGERCGCGSRARRFVLHGRVDGQIRIWSSRVLLSEIESAFERSKIEAPVFQVEIREDGESDKALVYFENESLWGTIPGLRVDFYQEARDLQATQSLAFVQDHIEFVAARPGSLPRMSRTGKVRPLIDYRNI